MYSFKALAPAGIFPNWSSLWRLYRLARCSDHPRATFSLLKEALSERFNEKRIEFAPNGKSAIVRLLTRLQRKHLCVSAYTCPDIVAAAARAGYSVYPVDIDSQTLDLNPASFPNELPPTETVLLLSNLYGLCDSLAPWKDLTKQGMLIIDDACQAALSLQSGYRVGARPQTLGILSFGRGKAICGIGGGAIISADPVEENAEDSTASVTDWVQLGIVPILEHPILYKGIRSLPFLGLGETHYDPAFASTPFSTARALAALTKAKQIESTERVRIKNVERFTTELSGSSIVFPHILRNTKEPSRQVLIRLPVLFPNASARDNALGDLTKLGLGASGSYPGPLQELCQGEKLLVQPRAPSAKDVSLRIMTLPLHEYVTEENILKIVSVIRCYA